MRGTGRFTRDVFTQIGAMVVGTPDELIPEMGLKPLDGDAQLVAFAMADTGTDGGWTHVYVTDEANTLRFAGLLCEHLSDEQFALIGEAREAKKEAELAGLQTIAMPDAKDLHSFGKGPGSNGDLVG